MKAYTVEAPKKPPCSYMPTAGLQTYELCTASYSPVTSMSWQRGAGVRAESTCSPGITQCLHKLSGTCTAWKEGDRIPAFDSGFCAVRIARHVPVPLHPRQRAIAPSALATLTSAQIFRWQHCHCILVALPLHITCDGNRI